MGSKQQYDVRISERIVANRSRCSFAPEAAHEVAEVVKGIPKVPRYSADGVVKALHRRMVDDLSLMNIRGLGKVVLPHDACWVEFIGGKHDESPVFPARSGVFIRKIRREDVPEDSPALPLFENGTSYLISGHVVIAADVPCHDDPTKTVRGYMFDPFRVLVPVGVDETARDFSIEMLVKDETSQQLVQEVMRSSSRVMALGLFVLREVALGRMSTVVVDPTQKWARIMMTKPERAALMPHRVVVTKGWSYTPSLTP